MLIAGLVLAFLTYRRTPPIGELHYRDANDKSLRIYKVDKAKCNIHVENGSFFLTMNCVTTGIAWPEGGDSYSPWLEVNVPFDKDPTSLIQPGARIPVKVYSQKHLNLTNFYYSSIHADFLDATIRINHVTDSQIDATLVGIDGAGSGSKVAVRAAFARTPAMGRSFD